jgi:hypothetical protein
MSVPLKRTLVMLKTDCGEYRSFYRRFGELRRHGAADSGGAQD